MVQTYTYEKIARIFDSEVNKTTFYNAFEKGEIPEPIIEARGKVKARVWPLESLPLIGNKFGFLKKDGSNKTFLNDLPCGVITSYARKGGVLKSTIAFNTARIAALHGIKTCIVGLDSQCDITRMLGHYDDIEQLETLEDVSLALESKIGLYELFEGKVQLEEIILPTDLPSLFFIPETDKIEYLTDKLESAHRREYWLEENVISKLRNHFDLIVIDCSPTSGRLIANAIYSSDLILSPIECSINNYRNYKSFEAYLDRTLYSLQKEFTDVVAVPTKKKNNGLSKDIYEHYIANIPHSVKEAIPLSSAMEDAVAMKVSVIELAPKEAVSRSTRNIMIDVFKALEKAIVVRLQITRTRLANELLKTNDLVNDHDEVRL